MTPQQAQLHHWVFAPCAYWELFWVDVVSGGILSRQVLIAKKNSEWNKHSTYMEGFYPGMNQWWFPHFYVGNFMVKPNGEGQGFFFIKYTIGQPSVCLTGFLCNFDRGLGGFLIICWVSFWQTWIFQNSLKWFFLIFRNKFKWHLQFFSNLTSTHQKNQWRMWLHCRKWRRNKHKKWHWCIKFKTWKLQTKHKHIEGELNPSVMQLKVPPNAPKCN
jgi:hypothetical protein